MTIVARRIMASPKRTASETWEVIKNLICGTNDEASFEFCKVSGIASSLIAEEIFRDYPLVMIGSGPRLKVYCLYGEDALIAEEQNEDSLRWEPTKNNWKVFLPCLDDDLHWFSETLKKKSDRFFVYDVEEGIEEEEHKIPNLAKFTINEEEFKKL